MWKVRYLKPPPACSLKVCLDWDQSKTIQQAYSSLCKAEELLESHNILWTENFLLKSLIYKLKNRFQAEKFFQGLKKIRSCLKRFKEVQLEKILSEIKLGFQMDLEMQVNKSTHLPSQQTMQYILVRLMGTTALLTQMANYCVYTFLYSRMQLKLGSFIPQNLLFVSLVSRIWLISKSLCTNMGKLYDNLTTCLPALPRTNVSWLPVGEELPQDLMAWLVQIMPSHDAQQQDVASQMQKIVEKGSRDAKNEDQKMTHAERGNNYLLTYPEPSSVCTLEDIGEPVCRGKSKLKKKKREPKTASSFSQKMWTPSSKPSARGKKTWTRNTDDKHPIEEHLENDSGSDDDESVITCDASRAYGEEPMITCDTSSAYDDEPVVACDTRSFYKGPILTSDTRSHSAKSRKQVHIPLEVDKIVEKITRSKKIGNFLVILKNVKSYLDKYYISTEQFQKCHKKIKIYKKKTTQCIQRRKEYLELGRKYMTNLFQSQNCVDLRKSCRDEHHLENTLEIGEEKILSPLSYEGNTLGKSFQIKTNVKIPKGKKSEKYKNYGHGGNKFCVTSDAVENQNKKGKQLVEMLEVAELKKLYKGLKVKKNNDVSLQNLQFSMSEADRLQFKKKIGFYCKKLKGENSGNDEELSRIMTKAKKYVNKFLNTKSLFITGHSGCMQPEQEILLSKKMPIAQNKTVSDKISEKERKNKQARKKKQKHKMRAKKQ